MQKNHPLAAIGRRAVTASILACAALGSQAAVVLTNGSFETTGSLLSSAIGGLYAPVGWTNQSGLAIQASSALAGAEFTSAAGATGARFLRLASDAGAGFAGFIVQDMGTMVAGEGYSIVGDVLGGRSDFSTWAATFKLTSGGQPNPASVFASQHVTGIGQSVNGANAVNLSYLATAADDGQHLFMWIRADDAASGTSRRGGVDNLRLTVTPAAPTANAAPEPSSLALVGLALVACSALVRRRR